METIRASRPGSFRASVLFLSTAAAALLAGCASSSHPRYGGLPSWLPKVTVPVGQVLTASAAHPVLGIEGDTVSVVLASGHVTVEAVGPAVPEEGKFPVPPTTPCTFTVTFSGGAGTIIVDPSQFTIVDERGILHHPEVSSGTNRWPRTVATEPITMTVSDTLPTGNGQLRWSPAGQAPIVSWDFDVEID